MENTGCSGQCAFERAAEVEFRALTESVRELKDRMTRLESALARPLNIALYESPDVARLAASYGVGLAKNHPFTDGNKRAVFLAVGLFLLTAAAVRTDAGKRVWDRIVFSLPLLGPLAKKQEIARSALEKNVISSAEHALLVRARELTAEVIKVDDFPFDLGLQRQQVQAVLGHKSAKVTLDVYGHLWPGEEDRVRDHWPHLPPRQAAGRSRPRLTPRIEPPPQRAAGNLLVRQRSRL